jgi:transposase-like protein
VFVVKRYQKFTPEFREETAKLIVEYGRVIADVAREIGAGETTVGNWVKAYREKHAGDEPPLELSERARLRELERRNRELEMEAAFLRKAAAYFAREQR